MKCLPLLLALLVALLAGCAPNTKPDNHALEREAIAGTNAPPPPPTTETQIEPLVQAAPQATTTIGTGTFVNERAARAPMPTSIAAQGQGAITFNFENQPVQAAVKAILGDVLHENYVIAPGVQGTVTFSTSQPIDRSQVLPVLEMLLSWTNNALVHKDGRYVVMPSKDAAAGNLVPGLGAATPGSGYAARLFPLHYVSADAMQKLLKPFAPADAFLLVDPQRNVLVMAGTPEQLANYQRTVRTFDVDWLRGMSVAVIPLQHVETSTLMPQLDQMFGAKGDSPMAGMARFIPLEHSNSIVVITAQPTYVDEVRDFIAKIDAGAGGSSGLYVYDVKNIKASDLAEHLNALYNGTSAGQNNNAGAVAPGFSPLEQGSKGLGGTSSMSNNGFDNGGSNGGDNGGKGNYTDNGLGGGDQSGTGSINGGLESNLLQQRNGGGNNNNASSGTASYTTQSGVRIAAVDENNQLLVRARPSQWQEMLPVIERLDQVPLQVQIETRVLEVDLTGDFSLGVQYYLAGLIGTQPGSPPGTNESFHRHQGAAGLGGVAYNAASDALFYSFAGSNLQFAIRGLETSGNTKILSEPSTVVLNNHETQIKVGDKIPVVQTYITPGLTTGSSNYNTASVQYIDTGVLLDVTPRVNPGGLVYLNIQQVVSKPTGPADQYGNYTIANRALSTQVAVQSGQTVLLGGLIQQNDTNGDNGLPFLNRIPWLGRLFGTTTRNSDRQELIVLITPRVISNAEEARALTDEYQTKFESLKPILEGAKEKPARH